MACQLNRKKNVCLIFFLIVVISAIFLRVPGLAVRPMHTDEAVQAVKFGSLLENNIYRYDRGEYHGPTLYYFTLLPAWISSAGKLTEIDETTLRIVPVIFGIMLIIITYILKSGLSLPVVTAAGFLTAISPLMVFYSRYYIQETVFVFFAFASLISGYRYFKSRKISWALATGVSLGLLHATKETSIIVIGSMLAALLLTLLMHRREYDTTRKLLNELNFRHIITAVLTMIITSAILYSSFFTNPSGIIDSYLTYINYFDKASNNDWHIYPWYYYLKILAFSKGASGPVWSELFIIILAVIGLVSVIFRKGQDCADIYLMRFISLYTIIMIVIFSAIPYKTPWNMLCFFLGLILLAAVGFCALFNILSNKILRIILFVIFMAGCCHLTVLSYLSNNKYYAAPSNPYVYSHTSIDINNITNDIKKLAEVHPNGNNMYIEVICRGNDYWPLPWYLRDFPNTGWWNRVNMDNPAAPVIIASPEFEPDITKKLYEIPPPGKKNLYLPLFETYTELRPMVELRGYVIKELWDKYQQSRINK